jgi:hypothetical protein
LCVDATLRRRFLRDGRNYCMVCGALTTGHSCGPHRISSLRASRRGRTAGTSRSCEPTPAPVVVSSCNV